MNKRKLMTTTLAATAIVSALAIATPAVADSFWSDDDDKHEQHDRDDDHDDKDSMYGDELSKELTALSARLNFSTQQQAYVEAIHQAEIKIEAATDLEGLYKDTNSISTWVARDISEIEVTLAQLKNIHEQLGALKNSLTQEQLQQLQTLEIQP